MTDEEMESIEKQIQALRERQQRANQFKARATGLRLAIEKLQSGDICRINFPVHDQARGVITYSVPDKQNDFQALATNSAEPDLAEDLRNAVLAVLTRRLTLAQEIWSQS